MPGTLIRVQRARLHDQVARKLALELIAAERRQREFTLPNEAELCRKYDVSRTALREAVKTLSAKGFLDVGPRTGMRLRPRSKWNLLDPDVLMWQCEAGVDDSFVESLCDFRMILEPAAAELAADRATANEVANIQHWFNEMKVSFSSTEELIAADIKFHESIFSASHNEFLASTAGAIGAALRASLVITTRLQGASFAALPLHKAVADSIARHNRSAARTSMSLIVAAATRDIYRVRSAEAAPGATRVNGRRRTNKK
jgi:GntR family galactonate operon transcriptional repressor